MTFCCEMDDGSRMKAVERFGNRIRISHIPENKAVARVVSDGIQVFRIAGVGERIKVHHGFLVMLKPFKNEV